MGTSSIPLYHIFIRSNGRKYKLSVVRCTSPQHHCHVILNYEKQLGIGVVYLAIDLGRRHIVATIIIDDDCTQATRPLVSNCR